MWPFTLLSDIKVEYLCVKMILGLPYEVKLTPVYSFTCKVPINVNLLA